MADHTKVRLEVHAQKLKNVAGTLKGISDPFCVVTLLASDPSQKPTVLGKTEVIKNSLSPRWTTTFDLDYDLTRATRINVGVWDEIKKGKKNKPMGSALFEVGEVLGSRGNTKAKKIRQGGTLFARITPIHEDHGTIHLNLKGIKLKNVDGVFGKSDPFFEVLANVAAAGGLTWQPVYRSKPIMNNLNPSWPPFSVDLGRLCEGDFNKPIMVRVWDWEKNGKHTPMGGFETTVNALMAAHTKDASHAFQVLRKGKEFGKVHVTTAKLEGSMSGGNPSIAPAVASTSPPARQSIPESAPMDGGFAAALDKPAPPTATMSNLAVSSSIPQAMPPPMLPPANRPKFVDYLTGGCELGLSIAIDFTGSNGDPRRPGTLHYRPTDGTLNDYEKAITAVGAIIARYDHDQKFPVFGFGAKYSGVIQHCFQIGGKPELDGIAGVLEGYRGVFRTGLTMSGPTVFDEVISYAAASARSEQEAALRVGKQTYKILLILTDGAVSDIEATKRAVQAASNAPLSVVVVGIGNADFSAMQHLDDFLHTTSRDIVQFVELSNHLHDRSSLTKATLEEIPTQLVDYFHGRGIVPLPAVTGSQLSLHPEEPTDEDIDLSLDINDEGEIALTDYTGAVYDDTKYATQTDYSNPTTLTAPVATGTPQQPFQPSAGPLVPGATPYAQLQYHPNSVPVQAAVVQPQQVFHVQVPPNVQAGSQLQVQNPRTQQSIIVTIPPGVPPGGTFAVPY